MSDIREQAKELARAAAWEEGEACRTCNGAGKVSGGRKLINTVLGGFGADWELDEVVAEIDAADRVEWINSIFGHDLKVVSATGKVIQFQVRRPSPEGGVA